MMNACTLWCNPAGPDLPFGTPWLIVWDTIRVLCALGGVAVLVMLPGAIRRTTATGQHARLVSFGLFALIVLDTEISHIGDDASVRLALCATAIWLAVAGMWRMRSEHPAEQNQRRAA